MLSETKINIKFNQRLYLNKEMTSQRTFFFGQIQWFFKPLEDC